MGDTHDAERRQPLSEGCTVVEVAAVCIRAHRNVFVPGMFNPLFPPFQHVLSERLRLSA